jgi:hypothetical protein
MMRCALLLLAACAGDPVAVAPLGDYTTWKQFDTYGKAPGHGDTYRTIYVNDIAEGYLEGGGYDSGSTFVKEIYDRNGDQPGALRIIEIMRRVDPGRMEGGGWLFTDASTPGGPETEKSFCWRRCHQAAPFEGAWFDYSK